MIAVVAVGRGKCQVLFCCCCCFGHRWLRFLWPMACSAISSFNLALARRLFLAESSSEVKAFC